MLELIQKWEERLKRFDNPHVWPNNTPIVSLYVNDSRKKTLQQCIKELKDFIQNNENEKCNNSQK